ncbi:hypothetical protein Fcan01_13477 [Folsomia candida]|uniref:Uncharacterized protein n=1 Tax=Folsomia candida TaxID=158441 RepID=A0A226E3L7_FOLCA|nr:hypothetical protein Fcan01_13477 [Folsomia candida]
MEVQEMIEVVLNENLNSDALTKLIRGDHGSILKKLKLKVIFLCGLSAQDLEFGNLSVSPSTLNSKNKTPVTTPCHLRSLTLGRRQNDAIQRKPKSASHSILSQRIAIRASLQKNIKLMLTPELFREDTSEPFNLDAPFRQRRQLQAADLGKSGVPSFGITNSSRTKIMREFAQYRSKQFEATTPISKTVGASLTQTTPVSAIKRRCTPKSLFGSLTNPDIEMSESSEDRQSRDN